MDNSPITPLKIKRVLHPTDLRENSAVAFAYALQVALQRKSTLTLIHIGKESHDEVRWDRYPPVRKTLEQWGYLEENSRREDVFDKLKMKVQKLAIHSSHPVKSIVHFTEDHDTDLIVMGTERRGSMPSWLGGSKAEPIARKSKTLTLFVPEGARGFVSLDDGTMDLHRILVPVDSNPDPASAIDLAMRMARSFGEGQVQIDLLHVGDSPAIFDRFILPENDHWNWNKHMVEGDVFDGIISKTAETHTGAIVMTTAGHQSLMEALRGSTTERIIREVDCPVLAVPAGWAPELES